MICRVPPSSATRMASDRSDTSALSLTTRQLDSRQSFSPIVIQLCQ